MKAIYKHIAFAALALSAVACTQEDDFITSYQSDPNAVRITAQVGDDDVIGDFTRSNPLGDATAQAAFNTNDQISVAAGTQAAVTYTFDGTNWTPETGKYLKWEADEMSVTAYYPVTDGTSATSFTLPTSYADLAAVANADYMTYSRTATKGIDMNINLAMERKMVRLVVNDITFNEQYESGYSVKAIAVHANTNGYADGAVQTGEINITAFKHEDNNFYALLAPTKEAADAIFLTITVTDGTTDTLLTVKGIPATVAGNSYNLSLTVGKDIASVVKVDVNEWTGATIEEDGVAEDISVTSVTDSETLTTFISVLDEGVPAQLVKAAAQAAIEASCTTIVINVTLSNEQQNALAEALTSYTGTLVLENTEETVTNEALKALTNIGYAGFITTTDTDEIITYQVYTPGGLTTLIDNATNESNLNIKLMADMTATGELTTGNFIEQSLLMTSGNITLDLNGKTITNDDLSDVLIKMDGGTLTINDNSDSKSGKMIGKEMIVYIGKGDLVINGGNFESTEGDAVYGVGLNGGSISIHGGNFTAAGYAVAPQNVSLTITGGTFISTGSSALYAYKGSVSVSGGRFTGKTDISTNKTGFLSFNEETGEGASFPDGMSIYAGNGSSVVYTVNSLLATGAGYFGADGNQLTVSDDAASIGGDVTVKRVSASE